MNKAATLMVCVLVATWINPVMAYIDPGSGSAIMSAIIGLFVAVGLAIKTYWYKLKSLFTGSKPVPEDQAEKNTESQDQD